MSEYIHCPRTSLGSKKTGKISIVLEDLSRNSVFFRTEVKLFTTCPYFAGFAN